MSEKCTTTQGRPARALPNPIIIMQAVVRFLQLFVPRTLATRIVGAILIAAGVPNDRVGELTDMSDSSVWRLRKTICSDNVDEIFAFGSSGGRPGKARGFEVEIAEELERNNYHSHQQIADMIYEKFGIKMSVSAVGRLLKKTVSGG